MRTRSRTAEARDNNRTGRPPQRQWLLVLGAGSFAEEVADLAEATGQFEVKAFVEGQDRARVGKALGGLPIRWVEDIGDAAATHHAVAAMGTTHRHAFIEQVVKLGFSFATIIHPSAQLSRTSRPGTGAIVGPNAVMAAHTSLGKHVIVNRGCLIGHHTAIGNYCTLAPGANIGGGVTIGTGTFVGIGAVVCNNLKIGAGAVIGGGAVVHRDVPDRVQVLGVPARIVKREIEGW